METVTAFTWIDWSVVAAFMLATTWIGHLLRGKEQNLDDFFLGGRNVPWWAVSISLVATQTSALTFIAVPAFIFKDGGDFRYLQMVLGFILGHFVMAATLIKPYYQMKSASPYDFIEGRLGKPTAQMSRLMFLAAVVLSQSIRLLSTAVILSVVTGMNMGLAIVVIVIFAVIWTWMGGITTVIWTDVVQFVILMLGAFLVLGYAIGSVDGGMGEVMRIADDKAKLRLIDISMDPTQTYTLWVALIGATVFQWAADAVDQVSTQRLLCCKSVKEARRALVWAGAGTLTTIVLAFAALGVVAFYYFQPPSAADMEMLTNDPDRIFPFFVVNELPIGVSGLIVAAFFAAGITTLDSALSALSQTFINGVYRPFFPGRSDARIFFMARASVVVFAVLLGGTAFFLETFGSGGLLRLGLALPGYTLGPILGFALLAWMRRGTFGTLLVGSVIAIVVIQILTMSDIAFFWAYPVGAGIVFVIGYLFSGECSSLCEKRSLQGARSVR